MSFVIQNSPFSSRKAAFVLSPLQGGRQVYTLVCHLPIPPSFRNSYACLHDLHTLPSSESEYLPRGARLSLRHIHPEHIIRGPYYPPTQFGSFVYSSQCKFSLLALMPSFLLECMITVSPLCCISKGAAR